MKRACFVLHGGPGYDSSYFHPFLDPLQQQLDFHFIDYNRRDPDYSFMMERLVADLEVTRQQRHLEKIVLLGHSAGGYFSLEYALRFPERVTGLILVGTAGDNQFIKENAENAARFPEVMKAIQTYLRSSRTDEDYKQMAIACIPFAFHRPDNVKARALFERMHYNARCDLELRRNYFPNYNLTPRLHEISAPALVITGSHDLVTPPHYTKALAENLPHATFVELSESGHFPFVEEPQAFCRAVGEWFEKIGVNRVSQ